MDIVRTNVGRIALSFTAHMMEGVQPDDNGKVEVIVYWDEVDGEYVITPKWSRVKEVVRTINLSALAKVELDDEEKRLLKNRWGLVPAIKHLKDRVSGLPLRDAKYTCDVFRSENMYWNADLEEYDFIGG